MFTTVAAANAAVNLTGSKLMGSDYSLVVGDSHFPLLFLRSDMSSFQVEPDLLALPEVQKLPEFLKVMKAKPHMLGGLPQHQLAAVRPDHKLQTGMSDTFALD
jgi:hypothetical protein